MRSSGPVTAHLQRYLAGRHRTESIAELRGKILETLNEEMLNPESRKIVTRKGCAAKGFKESNDDGFFRRAWITSHCVMRFKTNEPREEDRQYVVMKLMLPTPSTKNEINICRAIQKRPHDNIAEMITVQKFDRAFGSIHGFVVMESGYQTVDKFINEDTSRQDKLRIAIDVLEALYHCHTADPKTGERFTHRDLELTNMVCNANGTGVKLIDFGFGDIGKQISVEEELGWDVYDPSILNFLYDLLGVSDPAYRSCYKRCYPESAAKDKWALALLGANEDAKVHDIRVYQSILAKAHDDQRQLELVESGNGCACAIQ